LDSVPSQIIPVNTFCLISLRFISVLFSDLRLGRPSGCFLYLFSITLYLAARLQYL
jgi:hypothetical protein